MEEAQCHCLRIEECSATNKDWRERFEREDQISKKRSLFEAYAGIRHMPGGL